MINAECSAAYRAYEVELKQHYVRYFEENSKLRCSWHPYSARSVAAALPPGWSHLERMLPRGALHRYARSAKSSQILSLGLLGAACRSDSSMRWFWESLDLPGYPATRQPLVAFERALAPTDLNEYPHTTQLDVCVDDPSCLLAVECKWTEQGMGTCSCARGGEGSPLPGGYCAQRVIDRPEYWLQARNFLNLASERLPLLPCQLSTVYQVVRNIAAVRHLAGKRRPCAFVLIFDALNPFFRATGKWPGWPAVLNACLQPHTGSSFFFRAISWQDLVGNLPIDGTVRAWAREKHRLDAIVSRTLTSDTEISNLDPSQRNFSS